MADVVVPGAPHKDARLVSRTSLVVFGLLVASNVVLYVLSWYGAYRNGDYVIGQSDVDACVSMARHFNPDLSGVVWTKRMLSAEERQRSHVLHDSWLFGLIQRSTEDGEIEVIGTKDGQQRYRVTVSPGPFGIGWSQGSYEFFPPAH